VPLQPGEDRVLTALVRAASRLTRSDRLGTGARLGA